MAIFTKCDALALFNISGWARLELERLPDNKYALGVLAAINFVLGRDEQNPAANGLDVARIQKAAEEPAWVKAYREYFNGDDFAGYVNNEDLSM